MDLSRWGIQNAVWNENNSSPHNHENDYVNLGNCVQAYGLGQGVYVESGTTPHKPIKKHDIK